MEKVFLRTETEILYLKVNIKKEKLEITEIQKTSGEIKDKKAILGIPLREFFIKNIVIPGVSKRELKKTIEVQKKFHLPWDEKEAYFTCLTKLREREANLLLIGIKKNGFEKIGAILPLPFSLVFWGLHLGLVEEGKRHLLVFMENSHVHSVTLEGKEVLFMRSFKRDVQLPLELKFTSQAVYFRKERQAIDPDRVIIFTGEDPEEAKEVFKNKEFYWIKPEECLEGDFSENSFLGAGLSLFKKYKKDYKNWNPVKREDAVKKGILRGIIYTLPVWPFFLVGYYWGDTNLNLKKLKEIQMKEAIIKPVYLRVLKEERAFRDFEDFMNNWGISLRSSDVWLELMKEIFEKKPLNMEIEGISGSIDGSIYVNGWADSYEKISNFFKKLQKIAGIKELKLLFTQREENNRVNFQFSLKINPEEFFKSEI